MLALGRHGPGPILVDNQVAPPALPWAWNDHSEGQAAPWHEMRHPALPGCPASHTITTEEQLRSRFFSKGSSTFGEGPCTVLGYTVPR